MRTTRSTLENLLRFVNRNLNRPETAWTKDESGKMQANVGHLGLSSWHPGDGWTRYQIYELMEHGGESTISPTMTAAECFHYLRGILDTQQDNRLRPYPETQSTKAVQS